MADEGSNPVISLKVAGRMRRLATPKHWRSAIASGELTRDTPVTIERGPGRQAQQPAGEIAELSGLFDELVGPVRVQAPPPPPPPPPPPSPAPTPAASTPEVPRAPTANPWVFESPSPDPSPTESPLTEQAEPVGATTTTTAPSQPPVAPHPKPDGSGMGPLVIGGGLIAAAIAAFLIFGGSDEGTSTDSTEAMAEDASDAFPEGFYASRDLPVLSSRSDSAPSYAQLSRGQQVYGRRLDGGWVELSSGGYVRAETLLAAMPPAIDRSTVADYFTVEPVQVLDGPSANASVITSIDKLTKVSVLGTVNGTYAEIITDGGAVGYVDWNGFGGVGGKGRQAFIAVENRCGTTKNVAISMVINGRRTTDVGYWSFPAGYSGAIHYSSAPDQPVYVDSVYNFFIDLGDSFHTSGNPTVVQEGDDKVRVNGRLVEMKRIVAELTPDGAYQVNFC